jgi:hypothetical protein
MKKDKGQKEEGKAKRLKVAGNCDNRRHLWAVAERRSAVQSVV